MMLASIVGCGAPPEEHESRLRKAAGLTTFQIVCVKDLWERTSIGGSNDPEIKAAKVTPGPGSLVTVSLTGPQLVDYLRILGSDAFPKGGGPADPLSLRMYNAIAPVVDKVKEGAPPGQVPEVRVDDPVGNSPGSPTPATTSSPTATK
jgi:hypothetical protein